MYVYFVLAHGSTLGLQNMNAFPASGASVVSGLEVHVLHTSSSRFMNLFSYVGKHLSFTSGTNI